MQWPRRGRRRQSAAPDAVLPAARDDALPAAPDDGMVTAELAVAMPSVVLTAGFAFVVISVGVAQVRALDAASVAARLAGRGESNAAVAAAVRVVQPGAECSIRRHDGGLLVATVATRVHPFLVGRLLPGLVIREDAVGVDETSVTTPR